MYCPNCGEENNDTAMFCAECGAELPHQQISETQAITETPVFKKVPVIVTILLTIITLGFYIPYWFLSRLKTINELQSEKKLSSGMIIVAIILFIAAFISAMVSGFMEVIDDGPTSVSNIFDKLSTILNLAGNIMLIIRAFEVRRILRDHYNGYLKQNITLSGVGSGLATFFFGVWYLQYKINRL